MTRAEAERRAGLPVMAPIRQPEAALEARSVMLLACKAMGISLARVLGPDRYADTIATRRLICAVLRAKGLSYLSIARRVGLDHSTVMHHVRNFDAAAIKRPELRTAFDILAPARKLKIAAEEVEAVRHRIADTIAARKAAQVRRAKRLNVESMRRSLERRLALAEAEAREVKERLEALPC